MIKYRPHRGGLIESMAECKEFSRIDEMLNFIEANSDGFLKAKDIVISESHGEDEIIGWLSWRYVCTVRFANEKYDIPQCIGMCDLGEI